MAKGRKTGGRNIQKGQVLNPKGAGAVSPALRAVRRLSQMQIAEIGTLILEGTISDLEKLKDDKNASILKMLFATVAAKAMKQGDHAALSSLLDRIVGKPKQVVEMSGPEGAPIEMSNVSEAERMERIAKIEQELKLTEGE
jgi:predicted YcjX-like family ATPase